MRFEALSELEQLFVQLMNSISRISLKCNRKSLEKNNSWFFAWFDLRKIGKSSQTCLYYSISCFIIWFRSKLQSLRSPNCLITKRIYPNESPCMVFCEFIWTQIEQNKIFVYLGCKLNATSTIPRSLNGK